MPVRFIDNSHDTIAQIHNMRISADSCSIAIYRHFLTALDLIDELVNHLITSAVLSVERKRADDP